MSQHIDQFCEELRVKLRHMDGGLSDLKAKIIDRTEDAERLVRSHLDEIDKRIENNRSELAAARSKVTDWLGEKKAATQDKIAEWKTKRETDKLHNLADRAERYAAAAFEIAAAAVDAAERAAMEAWLAREDATSAQVTQATRP